MPRLVPRRRLRAVHASMVAAALFFVSAGHAQAPVSPTPLPSPPAQGDEAAQPPPNATTYRIAGRVVDATDGRPLRHAAVTAFPNSGGARRDVESTENGTFSISGLPAGKYRLQGAARGYIPAAYEEHGQYSSAIVTGAGLDTESMVLRLQPAAMVSGRVTDEAGEAVRNAQVSLFRENMEQGVRKITRFRSAATNDLGAYELTRLPPGTYYLCVSAMPWYASYPPPEGQGGGLGVAPDVDPALNVVYPLTYYPAATEATGASLLALKAGERYRADFHLTPQPGVHLTVQLPTGLLTNGRAMPQVQRRVFDTLEMVPQQHSQFLPSSVEIDGLPPGSYVVRQFGQGGVTGPSRSVSLTGGSVTLDATSSPGFGTVKLVLGPTETKLPQTLRFALRQGDRSEPAPISPVKDGEVEFANVEPGDYRIEPVNGRWHVDAVTLDGKTQPGARLHVTGEGQTATVTLGAGTVGMSGFVRREGKGVSGAMVVLVPAGGDHSVELYRRDQSDLDGSFVFSGVVPGNYLLVAISDGWPLEWGKPEVLAPYLSQAVPVAVSAGGRGPVRIAEAVPAQMR